jgi:hypothetical protein
MLTKKIVILAVVVISLISVIKLIPKDDPNEELEITIREALYPERRNETTNAVIEFTIKNNNSKTVRLSNAKLNTFFGGFELGSTIIDEIIIQANSETTLTVEVLEDWSMVPLHEQGLSSEYSFQAQIDGGGKTEITQIKPIPRRMFPTIVEEPAPEQGPLDDWLDEFYRNIRSGGPPKDGIPPIDDPIYVNVDDAEKILGDQEIVFVMEAGGMVYVYPQRILVWHEIINEEINGVKHTLTYCPLTGSIIGYYGELEGLETNFGTSGKLINSNLVMYDRATDSYWPQILGVSIRGERKGESLNTFKVVWSKWELVKAKYPEALVLSEETGFIRSYGNDPYGLYSDSDSYYNKGEPFFSVMNTDLRLEPKEVVIGIKRNSERYAISKKVVTENRAVNIDDFDIPLAAFYDEDLDSVNVFSRSYESSIHSFIVQNDEIIDERTGSIWLSNGTCVSGELIGSKLEPVTHFDVMWFGWIAFYPDTGLYEE